MKKRIKVSAPGKLMLFGEHSVIYGKPCIVTAVDQRIRVNIGSSDNKYLKISAPQVNLDNYIESIDNLGRSDAPAGSRFVSLAVKNFFDYYKTGFGLKVTTESDFSSKFGFGSSSAVTVATIKALSQFTNSNLDNDQIFELSYKTVLDVQGVGSGFDVASAVWGGTIYYIKGKKTKGTLKHMKLPLIVGYTGIKADTPTLVRQVADLYQKDKKRVNSVFGSISAIVEESKKAILGRDLKKLGMLMNENQQLLKYLGVSSPELDKLIGASLKAGAYGAKLSGAGGGDCMIAVVPPDKLRLVGREIERQGGIVLAVKTQAQGVRVEKI